MENVNVPANETRNENRGRKFNKKPNKFAFNSDYVQSLPEHLRNLVVMAKNNAEIRRFTALGIINILKQKEIIDKDAKCFVSFLWDKWSVKVNGFATEYPYSHNIFITAFVASFSSFSAHAQRAIDKFCQIENNKSIYESVKNEDVEKLTESVLANTEITVVTDEENGD